jgi:hypothetical protein
VRLHPWAIFSFQVFRLHFFTFLFLVACIVPQICHIFILDRTHTKVPAFEKEYTLRSSSFFLNFIRSSLKHHHKPHCVDFGHHQHLPTQTRVNEDYSLFEHGSVVTSIYVQTLCRTALAPSAGYCKKLQNQDNQTSEFNFSWITLNMGAKCRCTNPYDVLFQKPGIFTNTLVRISHTAKLTI